MRDFYSGGDWYGDEASSAASFESEEIIDQFEKAMRMLRHRSHGFNLEAALLME